MLILKANKRHLRMNLMERLGQKALNGGLAMTFVRILMVKANTLFLDR